MNRRLFFLVLFFAVFSFAEWNVEQEILAGPVSSNERVLRGRQLLYKLLVAGDSSRALRVINYLDGFYSETLCPFSGMEKGIALLRAQKYDSALTVLIRSRRLWEPEARKAESVEERCVAFAESGGDVPVIRDPLYALLNSNSLKTQAQLDSLEEKIFASSVEIFYKDAASAFIPILFAPSLDRMETLLVDRVLKAGESFVQKYPMNEDGAWLNRNFLSPIRTRQSLGESASKDPFDGHLYGNGVGMELLMGIGFLTGDFKAEFHHRFWDFYAAVPIQLRRFVFTPFISFGSLETRENRRFSDVLWEKGSELFVYEGGISLGFVVFDHRLFKVEPFVGIAFTDAAIPEGSGDYYYVADKPNNNYHRLRAHVKSENSVAYLFGVTGEIRLLTTYSRRTGAPMNSISLRLKYLASYLDHDFGYAKMEGFSHKVLAGIGFFIW